MKVISLLSILFTTSCTVIITWQKIIIKIYDNLLEQHIFVWVPGPTSIRWVHHHFDHHQFPCLEEVRTQNAELKGKSKELIYLHKGKTMKWWCSKSTLEIISRGTWRKTKPWMANKHSTTEPLKGHWWLHMLDTSIHAVLLWYETLVNQEENFKFFIAV